MSKKIMSILGILLIISVIITIFIVFNRNDSFELEKINWELTSEQLADDIGKEFVLVSDSYIHTYKGIKRITDVETTVKYTFNKSRRLESIDILVDDYEEEFVDKIIAMSEKIDEEDREENKKYTLKLKNSKIQLLSDEKENTVFMRIEEYIETHKTEKNIFAINDINWEASRDEIKKYTKFSHSNENEEALGYIYDEIKDISDEKTEVIYYFDNSDNIVMVFFQIKYDDTNLKKTLDYFNISVEDAVATEQETNWKAQTSDTMIIVGHKTNDKMLSIAIGKNRN